MWVCFNCIYFSVFGALFAAVGAAQMVVWAKKKHRRYREDFGTDYPRKRMAIVPFLI